MLKFIRFLESIILSVLLVCAIVSAGQAIELPDNLNLEEHLETQILPHTRILGFESGRSTFNDIQRDLGPSVYSTFKGTRRHSQKQICYKSNLSSDNTIVIFRENMMSGGYLQSFIITNEMSGSKEIKNCAPSPKIHKNTTTESGLGLNLSLSQLIAKMGSPYRYFRSKNCDESKLVYIFMFQDSMTAEEVKSYKADESPFFDVGFYAELKIRENKIVSISISKSSTY